jgi:type VI secretion system secreted protein VgrG
MQNLELSFASGVSSLSVRRFAAHEALSAPFTVAVWARSPDPSIDLESLVGKPAALKIEGGPALTVGRRRRVYSGIVSSMELRRSEERGLSTYHLVIVPRIWLLQHRINHRIYQHLSIPSIVERLLGEWDLAPLWRIDRRQHPPLEYKVQYGETDLAFFTRLLEEAGITFYFDDAEGEEAKLVLSDTPARNVRRKGPPIPYVDSPTRAGERELVTNVHLSHEVRPGALTLQDVDFRRPAYALRGEARVQRPEDRYEQYQYHPGAFLIEPGTGGDTPEADDRPIAMHDERFGHRRAHRALLGERMGREVVRFDANVIDLAPGTVFAIQDHAHRSIDGAGLLVTGFTVQGSVEGEWAMMGQAVFAATPYVPPEVTARPTVHGVQSATVVGPAMDEIHTDEFGRVRVQFPWAREGKSDEKSSSWIRVSQAFSGRGYGTIHLPRVGQEVLVAFLEGDPDRPVIVARVYNQTEPVPDKLPDNNTMSHSKSHSSPSAEGFNLIQYEDRAGAELVNVQAQKDVRKLVKNDEIITVLRDRAKSVGVDETDTTGVDRFEVTRRDRSETTSGNRMTHIKANRAKLIKKDESERTQGNHLLRVGRDQDILGAAHKRERIRGDSHLHVRGKRNERIGGTQSLTVLQDQFEEVAGSHALAAGGEIHLAAEETMVGEGEDVTISGPGGFIRIAASGVRIVGKIVDINEGDTIAGNGRGSKPALPEDAKEARIGIDGSGDGGQGG